MRTEKIQDGLADHENRIAQLEASQLYADVIPELRQRLDTLEGNLNQEQPEWTPKQWDIVQQLQGQVLHLQNKVEELLKTKKKPVKKWQ